MIAFWERSAREQLRSKSYVGATLIKLQCLRVSSKNLSILAMAKA
jgi:hypothetical protein